MTPDLKLFLIGMAGATAPEIIRLYNIRTNLDKLTWGYFVISFIFALLAGLLTYLTSATNMMNAFYIGISTPTLITSLTKKGSKIGSKDLKNVNIGARIDGSSDQEGYWSRVLKNYFNAL